MNEKKNRLLFLLWFLLAAGSRTLYFLFGEQTVTDTYGYFEQAMIRAGTEDPVFYSGLSHAFTRDLSGMLRFTGNIIDMVGVCQLLIQILWIMLFLAGIGMIFGKASGLLASGVFIISPWVIRSVFVISPENYYMLHFSLILVMLGLLHVRTQDAGWHENFWGALYLNAAGFFLGVLCVWNYLGWILAAVMIYVEICSLCALKDRVKEDKTLMRAGSRMCRLAGWMMIGICAELMSHTRLTGLTVFQQSVVWISQFKDIKARCMEVSGELMLWLMMAVFAGMICRLIYLKASKPEKEEEMPMEEEKDVSVGGQGRVKLLDNPLPVPKKHVRREISFDIEDVKLEFDVSISENDDFDI